MTELHNPELFSIPPSAESSTPPLAIVGMGCRFPGGANNPTRFWENLLAGKDCIIDVPEDRWEIDRFYDSDRNKPGKMYVRSGGFLQENIFAFDSLFFGISPREAASMDPQQRILLEVSWEALEDAGIDPESLAGSETGVFVGGFMLDNKLTQLSPLNRHTIAANTAVGMTLTMLSNRLSYFYDLRGPSMTIDTACSASMVALDQACQSLWNGNSNLALIGGVNIMHRPEIFIGLCKGGFLAADGRSKAFDARADGYGRGEGAGIIVVKPLADAKRDGDRIHALIRATGCNQDGHTDGITVPNPLSQQTLIRRVAQRAQVPLKNIAYFEAHGTGTAVGDPLEMSAIGNTIGQERTIDAPCLVGSVKSSIGHLEAASGVASLIKTTLCLKNQCVPPQANLQQLNPKIPFDELHIRIPQQATPLAHNGKPLHAAINSFGYGGTNACAVLESYTAPVKQQPIGFIKHTMGQRFLLPLSAHSKAALNAVIDNFIDLLDSENCPALEDLCYSAGNRRAQLSHRLCVSGNDVADIRAELRRYRDGQSSSAIVEGQVNQARNKLAFVFTGMGPQWWGMGRELFNSEPVFNAAVVHCDRVFKTIAGWSIIDELLKPEHESCITETQIAQPANFVIQIALVELLASWGIKPSAIVGHSVGEVATGYISGILSLEQALTVSFHRSRIQKKAANQGSMLAVSVDEATATDLIAPFDGKVSIAAINGPAAITLAGDSEGLLEIAAKLEAKGIFNRTLQVEVAYHSPTMDPLLDEIRECLSHLRPVSPLLPVYSTVTGELIENTDEGTAFDGEYWCRNVRQPVYFSKALQQMLADGYEDFIEIGPHPVLSTSIKEGFGLRQTKGFLISTLKRGANEQLTLKQAAASLYTHGFRLNWAALSSSRFSSDERGELCLALTPNYVALPTYPFQREYCWNEAPQAQRDRTGRSAKHAVLGQREDGPAVSWQQPINSNRLPYIDDHKVEGMVILPGAAYIEAALSAHQELTGNDACLLSELRFHNALVIDSDNERLLQTRVHEADGSFAIHSHTADQCDQHTLHATGNVQPLHLVSHRKIDLDAIKTSGMHVLQANEIYEELTSRGLQYGPRFQGIQLLWRRDGEVLATIAAHDELVVPADNYQLHPTVLDACFQSLISALPTGSELSKQVYIPVGIEQLRHYRKVSCPLYCHGVVHDMDASAIRGDIRLCDEQGNVLVEILNLRCQALRSLRRSGEDMLDSWAYQASWLEQILPDAAIEPSTACHVLLINRDDAGQQLREAFERHADSPVVAVFGGDNFEKISSQEYRLNPADPKHLRRLFDDANLTNATASLIYGMAMSGRNDDPVHLQAASAALAFMQSVQPLSDRSSLRICLLTQDAQCVLPDDTAEGFAASPLIGLGRVAAVELPALNCRCIDLDGNLSASALLQLVTECSSECAESEIALRGDQRFVFRLRQQSPASISRPALTAVGDNDNFELAPKQLASSAGSAFQMCSRREPGSREVEIEIEAARIDTQVNAHAADLQEVSARILRVGSEINSWYAGDEIVACYRGTLSRFQNLSADAALVMRKPAGWLPQQSANALSGLVLARTALLDYGRTTAEKSVLILGSDTATGQSLYQLAASLECTVVVVAADGLTREGAIPDAGAPINGLYLNSATLAQDLAALKPSAGFDIIVNTAVLPSHLNIDALLNARGQYIQLNENNDSAMAPVRLASGKMQLQLNKSAVMEAALQTPATTLAQLQALLAGINSFGVQLPQRSLDNPFADNSFTTSHTSAVLNFDAAADLSVIGRSAAALHIKPNVTYLITGGFGGFGLAMARWLIAEGARQLVLVSRSGARGDSAKAAVEELQSYGAVVHAKAMDIADGNAVQLLIEEISAQLPPLAGIFHTAGVLDDRELLDMDAASVAKVMRPKALGAWHLHHLTSELELDCFVLYSSVSALIGNRNQANYVAANVFLDNLAHHRHARGLPATSINWGALNDVGMAADANIIRHLEHIGITGFSAQQAQEAFASLMQSPVAQTGIFDVDWQRWSKFETSAALPRYEELVDSDDAEASTDGWESLHAQGHEALAAAVTANFSDILAATLKLAIEQIDPETPINRYGLDSLTAIDLQIKIRDACKVDVSILELMKGNSITRLAEVITAKMDKLYSDGSVIGDKTNASATPTISALPVLEDIATLLKNIDQHASVDAMSEDELDSILRQELALN